MFKNIEFFKVATSWTPDIIAAESAFDEMRFVECGASQEKTMGWTEPRGEIHSPLIESVAGHWIAKLMFESKILPGSVVKEETDKRANQIEQQTGRKPGKKEKKEIAEDARNALLSKAFTKKSAASVWLDPLAGLLVIESSTKARSDEIVTQLVKSLEGFSVTAIQTQQSPAIAMSQWLDTQELPAGFTADRDCALKSTDETKASVRYAKHPLDIEEIRAHIAGGKMPTQLALTWESRVSFVLTDSGIVKKVDFLEVALESTSATGKDSGFDADVAIATGELSKLIPALIEALGGSIESEEFQPT